MAALVDEDLFRSINFTSQLDSLDYSSKRGQLVCSNSNLEGDIWDGSINIINMASETENPELTVNSKAGCSSAKFVGSNHETIVAALDDGNIAVYSSADLKELYKLEGHDDIVSCLARDEANEINFFSAGWDGVLSSFTMGDGDRIIKHHSIEAHTGIVHGLAHSCALNLLATTGHDGFARLWDMRSVDEGVSHIINLNQIGSSVCWNGNSTHCNEMIVGLEDGNLKLYDLRNCGEVLSTVSVTNGRIRKVITVESTPNALLCGLEDSSVAVLRRGGIGEYEMVKSIVDRHKDYVTDLLYLQQTSQLITCSWDKTIAIGVLDIASIL